MNNKYPYILFRLTDLTFEEELEAARRHFIVMRNRSDIDEIILDVPTDGDMVVIPRYSALPYFEEMEDDIKYWGGTLIHSYNFHRWIASFDWYEALKPFTPYTWRGKDSLERFRRSNWIDRASVILKGCTNSRKHKWNTSMFAQTWKDVCRIYTDLRADSLIGYQDIVIREYVPLVTHAVGIAGIRFTEEYRCFFVGDELVAAGYYWTTAPDEVVDARTEVPQDAIDFASKLARLIKAEWRDREATPFFVLDVALTEKGEWILIEMNDGMMSGLSTINEDVFYSNLKTVLTNGTS